MADTTGGAAATNWRPALVAGAVALVSAGVAWSFTCDDAAITFRFAQQAAAGHPLGTVAAGDPLVSGFSNPTWTLGLAAVAKVGLPITGTAKVLGAVCFAVTALLATLLIGRLVERSRLVWVGCATGFSSIAAIWAVSGLENPLVGLLVVATAFLLVAEEQDARAGWKGLGSSVAVALLVVSRPDAFVYLGAAALARLLASRRRLGPGFRPLAADLARWLAAPVLVLAGWTAFSVARFGHPLANTVYAKVHLTLGERVAQMTDLGSGPLSQTIWFGTATLTAVLVPLVLIGCWPRRTATSSVTVLALATFVLPTIEIDWMADFRFYSACAPLLVVLAAVGLDRIAAWWEQRPSAERVGPRLLTPLRLGLALLVLWGLANVRITVLRAHEDFAGQVTVASVNHSTAPLARAGEDRGLTDPLVMTPDAGATVTDLDLRILDSAGLLDPQVAHLMDDLDGRLEYAFAERRPDLVRAGDPTWSWNKRWHLTPKAMSDLGYVRLPAIAEPSYIRRDLVVRPGATTRSTGGPSVDELITPTAVDGGPVTVRAWVRVPTADRDARIRIRLVRTGHGAGPPSTATDDAGAGLLAPDAWSHDEAVLHVTHLDPPAGDGDLEVEIASISDGQTTVLRTTPLEEGPRAVARAAKRLGWTSGTTAQAAASIQVLDDLRTAAPGQEAEIDERIDDIRVAALAQLRTELGDAQTAPEREAGRRLVRAIRGRSAPTAAWVQVGRSYQQTAGQTTDPEEAYELLVTAATADPSSPSIQADLLAARAARPSRVPRPAAP